MIPVHIRIQFADKATGFKTDGDGAKVGEASGLTLITAIGHQNGTFNSTYFFGDAQTRCEAGQVIDTSGKELSVHLSKYNPCVHTPIDNLKDDYRGTLTLNEPDGAQNIYLSCNEVATTVGDLCRVAAANDCSASPKRLCCLCDTVGHQTCY